MSLFMILSGCQKQESKPSETEKAEEQTSFTKAETQTDFDISKKSVVLNTGYVMPINGIGTYSLEGQECIDSILAALESGVRLIDTAYMYHNEEEIGQAIKLSDINREDLFMTTKIYPSQFDDPAVTLTRL